MSSEIKSLCVYCGSQSGNSPKFENEARLLGALMAQNNIQLVYGGGDRGIMGAVSAGCRENGGSVTGVIPKFLIDYEGEANAVNPHDRVIVTENMHERKQHLFAEADAFVALPGGIGTLEEIIEIMTWAQLDRHRKPIAFLNTNGFWDPLLELLNHMTNSGFLHHADRLNPIMVEKAEDVIKRIISV